MSRKKSTDTKHNLHALVDKKLYDKARSQAKKLGLSMTDVLNSGLRLWLDDSPKTKPATTSSETKSD